MAVQGIEQIRTRVSELNLTGARVDLTDGSMDAQVLSVSFDSYPYHHLNEKTYLTGCDLTDGSMVSFDSRLFSRSAPPINTI